MTDTIIFGQWIKLKREEAGISVRELSQKTGMSAPYLEELEGGRRCPPVEDKLRQIARVLEMSTEDEFTLFDLAYAERKNSPDSMRSEFLKKNGFALYAMRKAESGRTNFCDKETRAGLFARSFPFLPETETR